MLTRFHLLALCAALAAPAFAEPPITQIYPVRDLRAATPLRRAIPLGLAEVKNSGPSIINSDRHFGWSAREVAEMVEQLLAAGSWEGEGYGVTSDDLGMVVRQEPAVQAQVAALLAAMRGTRLRALELAVEVYEVEPGRAREVLTRAAQLGVELGLTGEGVHLRSREAISGRIGQALVIGETVRSHYLHDVDVEIAERAAAPTATTGAMALGDQLALTAQALPGALLVDLSWDRADHAAELRSWPLMLNPDIRVALEQPQVQRRLLRTTVVVPSGGVALAAAVGGADGGLELLVVRHAGGDPEANPEALRKISLGAWDLRALLSRRVASEPPALGVTVYEEGGLEIGEDEGLDDEDLVEAVRDHTPDAWDGDGCCLSYDGVLLVRQTPEVLAKLDRWVRSRLAAVARPLFVEAVVLRARDESAAQSLAQRASGPIALAEALALGEREQVHGLQSVADAPCEWRDVVEQTYVVTLDTEVAQGVSVLDPELGRLQSGLSLRLGSSGTEQLAVELARAEVDELRPVMLREGASFQAPRVRHAAAAGSLVSGSGRLLAMGGGRFLWLSWTRVGPAAR